MIATRPSTFFLVLAFSIIWSAAARAKTTTIDDSGTTALEPFVSLRWKNVAPPRGGVDNSMIGTLTTQVRLNVMPWLKRSGRIYLSLPAQQPGPMTLSWVAQARFRSGQLRSGNRILLYSGPITTPFMEDIFKFQFTVDGTLVRRPFPVTFHFEMDED
ncbi:MAG: hypothetical protein ACLPX1_06060 [Steroidobacteraceae bacterium]